MKNRWKHIFIPVPAMALCLSLAACGNSDDVAGDDWRTTGVVVGSGTIAHDGESVDVPVSYTHLDVYKRQYAYNILRLAMYETGLADIMTEMMDCFCDNAALRERYVFQGIASLY